MTESCILLLSSCFNPLVVEKGHFNSSGGISGSLGRAPISSPAAAGPSGESKRLVDVQNGRAKSCSRVLFDV